MDMECPDKAVAGHGQKTRWVLGSTEAEGEHGAGENIARSTKDVSLVPLLLDLLVWMLLTPMLDGHRVPKSEEGTVSL